MKVIKLVSLALLASLCFSCGTTISGSVYNNGETVSGSVSIGDLLTSIGSAISSDKGSTTEPSSTSSTTPPQTGTAEVEQLLGNPEKARTMLGWNPTETPFKELVREMVREDMKFVQREGCARRSFD